MPTFANLEVLSSIRTKINNLINAFLEPGLTAKNVTALLASTAFTYSAGSLKTVAAGDIITTKREGISYEVVALGSASTQYEVATAGGVLLRLLPNADGWFAFEGMAPVSDGVTDNYAKIATLIANKSVTIAIGDWLGPSITFPVGRFYFSQTINLKSRCRLWGQGTGFANVRGTDFIFPASTAGIIINRHNTLGDQTVTANSGAADGSQIVGIRLTGGRGDTFDATKSGIWQRARGLVQNCAVVSFAGHGIYSAAGSDGNPYLGNVNLTRVFQVFAQFNRGSGVFVDGTDANAGTFAFIDAKNNDGWCVYDESFLGNYHYGHHSESNALGSYGASNQSCFAGCYAEDGFGGASNFAGIGIGNTITVNDGVGPVLKTTFANGPVAMFNETGGFRGTASTHTTDIASEADSILSSRWGANLSYPFRLFWDSTGGAVFARFASSSNLLLKFGGASDAATYGRSAAVGEHINIPSLFLGLNANGRNITYRTSVPTTGEWSRGDTIFLTAPASGGVAQLHVTTGGTAGSTAVFRNAANIASS